MGNGERERENFSHTCPVSAMFYSLFIMQRMYILNVYSERLTPPSSGTYVNEAELKFSCLSYLNAGITGVQLNFIILYFAYALREDLITKPR